MELDVLQKIGFTKGESQVYSVLLSIGNTTSGALIKKSGVSRSKVYDVLERLKQKGLVTEMIKQNVKYFEATTPDRILDYIQTKQRELSNVEKQAKKIIPTLKKMRKGYFENQETKIYSGIEGWRTLYMELLGNLNSGDEYLAFGIGFEELKDKRVSLFFRNFHLKREDKKIRARILMSPETRNFMKNNFSDLKNYKYKFSGAKFPTNVNIHGNNVVTLVWGDNPVAFLIHSKQVADKYRLYFEECWKSSKK